MWIIIFLLLPILGLAYTGWHIWQILPFSNAWRWAVVVIGLLLFLTTFLNFSRTIDHMPLRLATACYEVGNSSIFILLYLVIIFLLLDAGRLLHIVPKQWLINNAYSSITILVLMLGVFIYGNVHYYKKVRQPLYLTTKKHSVTKKMKIVMLSDLHLGYHNNRKELERWIDLINNENPDLVLIGGDIIDISVRPLTEENMASEFHKLKAPIYACLGNHEYISGEQDAERFYRQAGITLLRDSVANIGNGLCIIGRDDRMNIGRKSIAELMKDVDKSRYVILLDHQPYHLERAEHAGVDFQFSGHTHHGQVWPVSWITDAIYECAFGEHRRNNTRYYVSSGMGIWGGKFRIGTHSEYIVATLSFK